MDDLLTYATTLSKQPVTPLNAPIEGRIAYVVSHGQSYASNGYAIRTQGVAHALNQHGLEILCFVRPGRPWELNSESTIAPEVTIEGVRYIHSRWLDDQDAKNSKAKLLANVDKYIELFSVYRPSAVLTASNYAVGLPAWIAAKRLGLPFYNEVRGFWELSRAAREPEYENSTAFKKEAERDAFVAKQAQKVFTLNQPMKEELVKRGVKAANIAIVPNGVIELPKIKPADPDLKKRLGIEDGDKVVGYIGSFSAYEGLEVLLEACAQLVSQGEKIKLLLVGDKQPITNLVCDHGMVKTAGSTPWLIQVGRVPHEQVSDYYALINTIVIPRKLLPVCELVPPMKAAEALAHGKSLVVSDVAALAEFSKTFKGIETFDAKGSALDVARAIQKSLKLKVKKVEATVLFSECVQSMANEFDQIDAELSNAYSIINDATYVPSELVNKKNDKGILQYEFPVLGDRVVVELEVVSKEPYAHDKAIIGVEVGDVNKKALNSESYKILNYRKSSQYTNYKYLSACDDGNYYKLSLNIPKDASYCVIRFGCRSGAKIKINNKPSVKFYSGDLSFSLLDVIKKNNFRDSPESIEIILSSLQFNASYVTELVRLVKPLPLTDKTAAAILWYLWRLTNDTSLYEMARQRLVFQGEMYETKRLLNEWDHRINYKNSKDSARRVKDEIRLLENGVVMPKAKTKPKYKPENNVLYLLHNRLPYNSGGYATRTHGLLTGIASNSSFTIHGVSRPGYPSDHAKHISKPLPSEIPRVDVVDGIEYFALEQNIRRSSLTTTEYIEKYAQEVAALAIEKKASIIHAAANFPNGLAASLAARRLGIKSVYEVRGLWEITRLSRQEGWDETDQFRFMAKMEAEACKAADAVITITEALKDLMVSRGVDASKITVAPNCVHTELFYPLEKDKALAEELGITFDDVIIGYIGSIVNYEGLDDLLSALALLLEDNVVNFKFLLVGDGAVLEDLKSQILNLSLQNHVIVTGRIPHEEVQRYYSLIDITPFPRKPYLVCETVSPLKPFEAMASQKAIIVSSCECLLEFVSDRESGLVFEKGSVISLFNSLKELILNEKLRSRLAKNGREWVQSNRDWKYSCRVVEDLYLNLMAN